MIPAWAKLDHAKAEEIRHRYSAGGNTARALAKEYGVHHKQICDIVNGKAWKAAAAIAGVMGTTLLLDWSGETFILNSMPIWVRQWQLHFRFSRRR